MLPNILWLLFYLILFLGLFFPRKTLILVYKWSIFSRKFGPFLVYICAKLVYVELCQLC